MAIVPYLAMTAAEMRAAPSLPRKCAWMACHFSPYSTGLTNLPPSLPPESLLILNDRTPIHGHDPERIREELEEALTTNHCAGLLLDFQRPHIQETEVLTAHLAKNLPFPVIVSNLYALPNYPVFLPPPPQDQRLETYLLPWKQFPIWLDIAPMEAAFRITPQGCLPEPPSGNRCQNPQYDSTLRIHYSITQEPGSILFHLRRELSDLKGLLQDAEDLGIRNAVGLFQQLQAEW